jgi:hypothetical protein
MDMPYKDKEAANQHQRDLYHRRKEQGYKGREWGTLEAICSICDLVRKITKNSLYVTKLPKDEQGRTIRKCRSCARREVYATPLTTVYVKDLSQGRRIQQRIWSIQYLGGKCVDCGLVYDETNGWAFDFDHRDPGEKEFSPSVRRYSRERIQKELDKCDLRCSLCHRKRHSDPY